MQRLLLLTFGLFAVLSGAAKPAPQAKTAAAAAGSAAKNSEHHAEKNQKPALKKTGDKKKTTKKKLSKANVMSALPQIFGAVSAVKSRLADAVQDNAAATKVARSATTDAIAEEADALGAAVGAYSANLTASEKTLGAAVDAAKAALDAAPAPKKDHFEWDLHGSFASQESKRVALLSAQRQLKTEKSHNARALSRAQEKAKAALEDTAETMSRLYIGDLSQSLKDSEEGFDEAVESATNPKPAVQEEEEDPALLAALQDSGFAAPTTTTPKPAPKKVAPPKKAAPKKAPSIAEAFATLATVTAAEKAHLKTAEAGLKTAEAAAEGASTKKVNEIKSTLLAAKRKALSRV